MKSIHVCTVACFVLMTQAAAAQETASAPGKHALMVRDGRIVHVRKDQGAAAPKVAQAETVTSLETLARTSAPGEHVVAIRNGKIVYIPKRHLEP